MPGPSSGAPRGTSALPPARRRLRGLLVGVAVIGGAALVGAGLVVIGGHGQSTDTGTPVPLSGDLIAAFTSAAASCPALTAPRLAGQVMAASGFTATADGGIAALTADQWKRWQPYPGARPGDAHASVLALAHLTCDLVGAVRLEGINGDTWRLAVAASRSSVVAVRTAHGVPGSQQRYVDRVVSYAAWYANQPGLGQPSTAPQAAGSPAVPVSSGSASGSPSASPAAVASSAAAAPTATPSRAGTTAPRPTQAAPITIGYASFADATRLRLNGTAGVGSGRLNLAAGSNQAGSAWSSTTIPTTHSFTTAFTIEITDITDGMAFVVQRAGPGALGSVGGGLGYGLRPGDQGSAVAPSVDLEFDTWDNSPDGFDPAGHQHIALMNNGNITQHLRWADPGFSMYGEGPVHVWVSYDAGAHTMAVSAGKSTSKPAAPLFTASVNLAGVVGSGSAYVGFTAATGSTNITDSRESVLNWSLTSS